MDNYTSFQMFENARRGRQARKFTTNVPKILDLKSSSEQIFFRKLTLGATDCFEYPLKSLLPFLNQATKKNSRNRKLQTPKILRSSLSFEIGVPFALLSCSLQAIKIPKVFILAKYSLNQKALDKSREKNLLFETLQIFEACRFFVSIASSSTEIS